MTDNDSYYRQRIEEELAAANSASDAAISKLHNDMAQLYRELLGVEPPRVKGSGVQPGSVLG